MSSHWVLRSQMKIYSIWQKRCLLLPPDRFEGVFKLICQSKIKNNEGSFLLPYHESTD